MNRFVLKTIICISAFMIMTVADSFSETSPGITNIIQDGENQIVLKLTSQTNYQVFRLRSPNRIVVYLYGSHIEAKTLEYKTTGKFIKYAKIYPFDGTHGTVRVEIGVIDSAVHRDWEVDGDIYLWIGDQAGAQQLPAKKTTVTQKTPPPPPPMLEPEEPATPEKTVDTPPEEDQDDKKIVYVPSDDNTSDGGDDIVYPEDMIGPEGPAPLPTNVAGRDFKLRSSFSDKTGSSPFAGKILDIVVTMGSDITRVVINTNGPLRSFDDFLLALPNRLVIDVFDVRADYEFNRLDLVKGPIMAVRWAPNTKDRVRIVLDFMDMTGALPYFKINKLQSGIEITIFHKKRISDAPPSDYNSYKVKKNESLADIAKVVYGDKRAWRRIVNYNRELFAEPETVLNSNGVIYVPENTAIKLPTR